MSSAPPITPVLVYSDIEAAHTFLVDIFGFEAGSLHRTADGQVVHGEVHVDGASIWLHRETADHGLASPQSHQASAVSPSSSTTWTRTMSGPARQAR